MDSQTPIEAKCAECGHPLMGRSDQRFCNDTCRNAFNRRKRKEDNAAKPEHIALIAHIIARNYAIMKALNTDPSGRTMVSRMNLFSRGFDFRYLTSIHCTKKGEIYRFCYEQGWLAVAEEKILLVVQYKQIEI